MEHIVESIFYVLRIGVVGDCSIFVDIVDDSKLVFSWWPIEDMGEFNVMIASKEDRHKGYGYFSVLLALMWCMFSSSFWKKWLVYHIGNRYLKLKDFFVKITKTNTPSIKLFEKIGFHFHKYNRHFNENEYRLTITNELSKRWIMELGFPIKM